MRPRDVNAAVPQDSRNGFDGHLVREQACAKSGFPEECAPQSVRPILVRRKREEAMCENIRHWMSSFDSALVVIGLAHLHSMYERLSDGFEIDGYSYFS
jgi:hypothetical protein